MGRDITYRYSVRMTLVRGFTTPAGWPTRNRIGDKRPAAMLGKPNDAKLAMYVAHYNESLAPGGVNSHIGPSGTAVAASIFDHHTDTVVATWAA